MGALAQHFDLQVSPCPDGCEDQVTDEVCGLIVCAVHSPEADVIECAESKLGLHHVDCRADCKDCQAALAYDDYEDRFELAWRGED